jgi:hypothetical protein
MATRFDDLSKALASSASRRDALRMIGGSLVGAALLALDWGKASAAPSPCTVFCGKTAFTSGPLHASCLQACRQCGEDVTRVCPAPAGAVCCAEGQGCFFNCQTGMQECCTESTICPGSCAGTCCPE